jgi:hypothetical protein
MNFYSVRSSALLALVFLCLLIPCAQAQFVQQGSKLIGTGGVGIASQGWSAAVSGNGNTVIVGGPNDNGNTGAAWVFTRSDGIWNQQGTKLVGTGSEGTASQGASVAVSVDGNTVVGGDADNNYTGAAWVFTRSDGSWTQQGPKLVGTGGVGRTFEGLSVSVSGDGNTAILGGPGDNVGTGAAWVFTRSDGSWTQQGPKLVGTGGVANVAEQGESVSISEDGSTAIVGGFEDNDNIGAAWVFTRSGGVWTQQGPKLVGTGGVGLQNQGQSVSVSADGNTTIVGGPQDNASRGAAWVFTRSGGVWTQRGAKLVGTGAAGEARQGTLVAVSGDGKTAVVGGPNDNTYTGATWVFTQSWKGLTNTYPGGGAGPCLVLTDGTVACNNSQSNSNQWYQLTPDRTGSYLNGTWSAMPNMPYQPVSYASAVLPNGQLIIQGGEYLNGQQIWTNQGAVYEPKTNSWTPVICNVIPSGQLGDSQSVILPDGTFMIANISNTQVATAAPHTDFTACGNNCYTLLSPTGKDDPNNNEGWTLLPNGDILTVDAIAAPNTQTYHQATRVWTAAGTTGNCSLEDSGSQEIGPQVLRPDGTAVAFGAGIPAGHNGACTAIYDTVAQTWTLGPDFPAGLDVAGGPASLLPNGNVLVMSSPGVFNAGAQFFEWDGTNLNPVPGPPNAASDSSYVGHMVVLPTGEVMFTDFTPDIELYATPGGTYQDSWRPVITGIPFLKNHAKLLVNATYEIDGLQFNGLSQGAAYGDDLQTATNYPLVRATQLFGGGNTIYFKTHDHSTMAVATGSTPVSTMFDIPNATVPGFYSLVVVANGIPSQPKTVVIGCSLSTAVDVHACTN